MSNVTLGEGALVHLDRIQETACGIVIRDKRSPNLALTDEPVNCRKCSETQEEEVQEIQSYINDLIDAIAIKEMNIKDAMWRLVGYVEEKSLK